MVGIKAFGDIKVHEQKLFDLVPKIDRYREQFLFGTAYIQKPYKILYVAIVGSSRGDNRLGRELVGHGQLIAYFLGRQATRRFFQFALPPCARDIWLVYNAKFPMCQFGPLRKLSKALIKEFGKGFSVANLKNFRQFYLTFPTEAIRYALRSELTWRRSATSTAVSDKEPNPQPYKLSKYKPELKLGLAYTF